MRLALALNAIPAWILGIQRPFLRYTAFYSFSLAVAVLCALPVVVAVHAAQPPYIYFEPATGPVTYYEARVRTAAEEVRYRSPDATPVIELAMLPIEPYWIDERGCNGVIMPEQPFGCGQWSLPHRMTADLDENGGVGISDWLLLRGRFSMRLVVEMYTHWGDVTVVDEEGPLAGIRRYEGE